MIDGLTTVTSKYGFSETVTALESEIGKRGMSILARIDHSAAAQLADLVLRPTVLLLFGAARVGTPLMQQVQSMGIDLPLKLLVWEDEKGAVQMSYNQPSWLAARHGVDDDAIVGAMAAALAALTSQA